MADPVEAIHHVLDDKAFHFPRGVVWELPQPLESIGFEITKYKVMQLAAALLCVAIFVPLAQRIRTGHPPRGRCWGFFETLLVFIRDNVARPAIGKHDADRFLPFLWTMFFFVLFCNLLGMVPWMGTATSSLSVTGVLAAITFVSVLVAGMRKLGVAGFWKAQVPHMDLPGPLGMLLKPMIFAIEVMGLLIKHTVLAIRLLANMAAGHVVLGVILVLIAMTAHMPLVLAGVGPLGVLGAVALSCLELFVAFLQAYIFAFLSALFIGMAVHPH
jgi:F-type H+-transporting ATPase subunit a